LEYLRGRRNSRRLRAARLAITFGRHRLPEEGRAMAERLPGFRDEYLWEWGVPEHHLRAIVEAMPAERFGWRPADDARSVSEVLVHIAAGNFMLLDLVGVTEPLRPYAAVETRGPERFLAVLVKIHDMEKTVTGKAEAVAILNASLEAVRTAFTQATDAELDRVSEFFGEQTTVRRVYMRMLAHTHEHMGQLIAYTRTMGSKAPWVDPMDEVRAMIRNAGATTAL
jgi:uncharacterized damage-inducible protein DinB